MPPAITTKSVLHHPSCTMAQRFQLTQHAAESRGSLQTTQRQTDGVAPPLRLLPSALCAQQQPQAEGDAARTLPIQQHRQHVQDDLPAAGQDAPGQRLTCNISSRHLCNTGNICNISSTHLCTRVTFATSVADTCVTRVTFATSVADTCVTRVTSATPVAYACNMVNICNISSVYTCDTVTSCNISRVYL